MRSADAPRRSGFPQRSALAVAGGVPPAGPLTEVELTSIAGRRERWIRFGRAASERIVSRRTRIMSFRAGAVFAFVRRTSNDFGTIHSTIVIAIAVRPGDACSMLPFVRPGADILARIDGWPKVQTTLEAIDAVEAAGIDAADAAPDHWRHVGDRIAAGLPVRPYGLDRHAAWLRRRAIEG